MRPSPDLRSLQHWMQAAIFHPGSVGTAIEDSFAESGVSAAEGRDLMKPSDQLSGAQRLDLYRRMYVLRMREALESDYPALADYLGARRFGDLSDGYMRAHPSRSYTLNRLGDALPDYLRTAPGFGIGGPYDLARLELMTTTLFDSAHSSVLTSESLTNVPADAWPDVRLKPIPGFGMLSLRYAATKYWRAVRAGEPRPALRRQNSYVVVYRSVYSVRHAELDRLEYKVLQAIVDGRPLGEALSIAQRRLSGETGSQTVFGWFKDWVERGYFESI